MIVLTIGMSFSTSIVSAQAAPSPITTLENTQHRISVSASTDQPKIGHLFYWIEIEDIATGEAVKTRASVKKNPANPKKVEKGKKLYKHMNGQDPEKVAVEKIDIGDVWYKVGEGGCWQIGYMSGKETGKEDQKYVHTFNEETKDGNFPELYATMPENGKPMLIIKGGTWKIRTDDTGVAWIYD